MASQTDSTASAARITSQPNTAQVAEHSDVSSEVQLGDDQNNEPKAESDINSKRHGSKPQSMLRTWWWWWEIGTTIASIASMASIIGVLLRANNKPLADWSFYWSPNSVLSTLTAIGKSCMMVAVTESISQLKWLQFEKPRTLRDIELFDAASRGPNGAIWFLLKLRGKALVAAGGAIITILALGIDPVTQMVLAFPIDTMELHNETASLGVASGYVSKAFPATEVSKYNHYARALVDPWY
jgi:Protein of unknown function (DUF3176)